MTTADGMGRVDFMMTRTTTNTTEITTSAREVRFNARCSAKGCKAAHSILVTRTIKTTRALGTGKVLARHEEFVRDGERCSYPEAIHCVAHRRAMHYRAVDGITRPEIPCTAKCVASKGHVCECACGGRNHGAGHG